MSEQSNYWLRRRVSRRGALKGSAAAGLGVAAYGLVGCGDDDAGTTPKDDKGLLPTAQPSPTPSKQAKPGGTFTFQVGGNPPNLDPYSAASFLASYQQGLVLSRLVRHKAGSPDAVPTDPAMEPDIASKWEQPDNLTYRFTIKDAKWHNVAPTNGRAVTAEDIKYGLERNALTETSPHRGLYFWLDKIEAPDSKTIVIKSKEPYADLLQVVGGQYGSYLVPKEHAETDAVKTKMIGSGPFVHTDFQTGVSLSYKKNPDYYDKPYPYFDEVKSFIVTDQAKRVADFSAKQQNLTWLFLPEERDQVKKQRPDAVSGEQQGIGGDIYMRSDKPPFNDKRVRQAASMALDRKAIRQAITKGEGVDDQVMFVGYAGWGRQVKDLPGAKYWAYNLAESKKLLDAAGYKGEEVEYVHVAEANIYTQAYLDTASLAIAQLKAAGFNIKEIAMPYAQYIAAGTGVYFGGVYNHMGQTPRAVPYLVDHVTDKMSFKNGKRGRINHSYINDPALEALLDKQRTQFAPAERKKTIEQIEDLAAENQWEVFFSTDTRTYFWDKEVQNYRDAAFFPYTHVMKAWFDKG